MNSGLGPGVGPGRILPAVAGDVNLPPNLVFASSFNAGTGTGTTAIYDDGIWHNPSAWTAPVTVRETTTEGFPTQNFIDFEIGPTYVDGRQHDILNTLTTFAALGVGESVVMRSGRRRAAVLFGLLVLLFL